VSPLAVPVLLEIGRESVRTGDDEEKLLAEAEAIIAEATGEAEPPHRGVPDRSGVKTIHRGNLERRRGESGTRRKPAQATLFNA
jgi:ATP-dependent Lhr-like helicase